MPLIYITITTLEHYESSQCNIQIYTNNCFIAQNCYNYSKFTYLLILVFPCPLQTENPPLKLLQDSKIGDM